mmetsp:Transcript_25372/g.60369  ORF Transcript_25372/g.60369 Transcript_25372/m.60369 type:complete len:269 (+) Transcript_25372:339-1145(+)
MPPNCPRMMGKKSITSNWIACLMLKRTSAGFSVSDAIVCIPMNTTRKPRPKGMVLSSIMGTARAWMKDAMGFKKARGSPKRATSNKGSKYAAAETRRVGRLVSSFLSGRLATYSSICRSSISFSRSSAAALRASASASRSSAWNSANFFSTRRRQNSSCCKTPSPLSSSASSNFRAFSSSISTLHSWLTPIFSSFSSKVPEESKSQERKSCWRLRLSSSARMASSCSTSARSCAASSRSLSASSAASSGSTSPVTVADVRSCTARRGT